MIISDYVMESLDIQKVKDKLKEIDIERNPDIYFRYPEEIINLLHDLEESNICLIRNSQNTEKEIEDLFLKRKNGTGKIDREIEMPRKIPKFSYSQTSKIITLVNPPHTQKSHR